MTSLTMFSTLSLQDCAAVTGGSKRKGWVDIGIGLAQQKHLATLMILSLGLTKAIIEIFHVTNITYFS